jgi:hypothetical protein
MLCTSSLWTCPPPIPPTRTLRRYSPQVGRYASWSEAVGKAAASVAVLYAADYGFSDRLSQTLARGVTKAGVATEMVDMLSCDAQVRRARGPSPAPGPTPNGAPIHPRLDSPPV